MPVIRQKIIVRQDLRANRDVLYIFGDNDMRHGNGGQAKQMRGEPNAVGVRTKYRPSMDEDAFWTDETYQANCAKIHDDLSKLYYHMDVDGIVVFPFDGIGTGLSQMDISCPKTFVYLQDRILKLSQSF